MRDPYDEDNPYSHEYEEWDFWCYANWRDPSSDEMASLWEDWPKPGWFLVYTGVDAEGHLVPVEQYLQEQSERLIGSFDYDSDTGCAATLVSAGPIDAGTRERLLQTAASVRAAYLLPVPQWLAQEPPHMAMHLPDGSLAIQGDLGAGSNEATHELVTWPVDRGVEMAWHLYNSEGDFLRSTAVGGEWWQLTFPDYLESLGIPEGVQVSFRDWNGEISAYREDTGEHLGSFRYDGSSTDGSTPANIELLDPRFFQPISGAEIPLIHAAQQHIEPVRLAEFGQAKAQLASLDLSRPLASTYSTSGYDLYINVRPLDDPDNPYQDQYREWEHWVYEDQERLCEEYDWNSLPRGENRWDLVTEMLPEYLAASGDGSSNGWCITPMYMLVDDNGYLIPEVFDVELQLASATGVETPQLKQVEGSAVQEYRFHSVTFLSASHNDQRDRDTAVVRARYSRQIPKWLADNPPYSAMFLPDDRIVAHGPLGSAGSGTYYASTEWYCYSADGELICQTEPGQQYWFEMFFEGFPRTLEGIGGVEAVSVSDWNGTVSFFSEETGRGLARYTYDGQRIEGASPWEAEPLLFFPLEGEYLPAMYAAQQEWPAGEEQEARGQVNARETEAAASQVRRSGTRSAAHSGPPYRW